jgi:hypothetical protein
MIIGIVGSEAAKFTPETEAKAKDLIRRILTQPLIPAISGFSSGHCHLGGIDIWTEEIGFELGLRPYIFPPRSQSWETGYKPRNIQIAETSDEVHNITLKRLPESYKGMKFDFCYHCNTNEHVKSGGCWTAKYAQRLKKKAFWHIID